MSFWGGTFVQDLLTVKSGMSLDSFHLYILFMQIGIATMVGMVILVSIMSPFFQVSKSEWVLLEVVWTIIPAIILIFLGIPSLELLYKFEGLFLKPDLIVKVTGNQWYWNYSFPEFDIEFDSFTEKNHSFRLGEVNEKLVLPFNCKVQLLVTSNDVIHSFSLPNLSVKTDCNPGRLNLINLICHYPSLQIGQCSELCGALHSNMTISVEFTSVSLFKEWINLKMEE